MLVHYHRHDATLTFSGNGQHFSDSASGKTAFLVGDIHNAAELADQLKGSVYLNTHPTGAELALKAYRVWGSACPEKFLGEFALVIVDPVSREIFCARDPIGVKPFFYHLSEEHFFFASTVEVIAEEAAVPRGICDEAVAVYLKYGELYHPRLTFFDSIKKLPPATTLLLTETGATEEAYWRPEDVPTAEFQSLDDCANQLKTLLSDAVQVRLPDGEPVASHLSGGLDSSTISILAGSVLGSRGAELHTFSWMAPPQNEEERTSAEWAQSQKVADYAGATHHFTRFCADRMFSILTFHNIAHHDTVDLWYEFDVRDRVKSLGVQTILSGWGGDQFITNYGKYRFAGTFWHGHPLRALVDLVRLTSGEKNRAVKLLSLGWRTLIAPVLPNWFPGKGKNLQSNDYLSAANTEFEQYAREVTRAKSQSPIWSVRADQLAQIKQGHIQNRLESWAVSAEAQGMDYQYPLLDRRIVEFALSIPPELYRTGGAPRNIFRRAIADLVPQEVWKDFLKLEPIRVQRLVEAVRSALQRWRADHRDVSTTSAYIDESRLGSLIDDILSRPVSFKVDDILPLMTAVKSILVLTMEARQNSGARSTEASD
jgi:asparagine synthase (glutamine-hydrolysing)